MQNGPDPVGGGWRPRDPFGQRTAPSRLALITVRNPSLSTLIVFSVGNTHPHWWTLRNFWGAGRLVAILPLGLGPLDPSRLA